MNVTDSAPLDIASIPSAPDPEKQSAHLKPAISKFNQLKRISLNLFDVGLSLDEEGKEMWFPFKVPPIILILEVFKTNLLQIALNYLSLF